MAFSSIEGATTPKPKNAWVSLLGKISSEFTSFCVLVVDSQLSGWNKSRFQSHHATTPKDGRDFSCYPYSYVWTTLVKSFRMPSLLRAPQGYP